MALSDVEIPSEINLPLPSFTYKRSRNLVRHQIYDNMKILFQKLSEPIMETFDGIT